MLIGIEEYTINAKCNSGSPTNHLIVDFSIFSLATEPKDYQPFIDRLQALCSEFRDKHFLDQNNKATDGGNY